MPAVVSDLRFLYISFRSQCSIRTRLFTVQTTGKKIVVLEAEFQSSVNSILYFWGECVAFFTALNSGPPLSNCCGIFFPFLYQSAHIAWSGRITQWWKEDFNIHVHSIFDVFVVDPIDFSLWELGFINLFSTKKKKRSWFVIFIMVCQAKNM